MSGHDDAIAALANTLDDLDSHIRRADATAKRSEGNRLSMLHLHAIAAVIIGPLFAAVGTGGMAGPTWAVARLIPGAPYTLAVILFVGGVILGASTWVRAVRWEMVGLWMLFSWYTIIAVSFGAALVLWLAGGVQDGAARPSPFAPALYGHFAAVMLIHLRTLRRITRRRARP